MYNMENVSINVLPGYGTPPTRTTSCFGSARVAPVTNDADALSAVARKKINKKTRAFEKKGFKREQLVVTPDGHVNYDSDLSDALAFHRAFEGLNLPS